nr:hypothetical protein B456_008G074800 [Gossypium raimondii]
MVYAKFCPNNFTIIVVAISLNKICCILSKKSIIGVPLTVDLVISPFMKPKSSSQTESKKPLANTLSFQDIAGAEDKSMATSSPKSSPFNVPSPLSPSPSSSKANKNQKINARNQQKQIISLSLKERGKRKREIKSFYFPILIMRRKCRTIGEIAVMELADVGVQTRAVATTGRVQKKRRRLNDGNKEEERRKVTSSTTSTTSYIQLRSRTILADRHRREGNLCLSLNSDHDDDVSCCSSNIESSDKRIMELPDLEDESVEVETSTHFSSSER